MIRPAVMDLALPAALMSSACCETCNCRYINTGPGWCNAGFTSGQCSCPITVACDGGN
jgi:hypothetical protein